MSTLRYAWRTLARSPLFVGLSVIALGLGLGLSTTMFAVLDAVVHPQVAYREPARLFGINWWFGRRNPMSSADLYRFIRDNAHTFEAVVPERWDRVLLQTGTEEHELPATWVTPSYFAVTGLTMRAGRAFGPSDGEDVAVLGDAAWRRLHGTSRFRRGTTLILDGRTVTVIGVTSRSADRSLVLLPLSVAIEAGGSGFVRPVVRLRAGVTQDDAARELKALAGLLTDRFAAREAPFAFELYSLTPRREELRDIHTAMVGAALVVLLIACVNLAHLMMARGLARRRELALRMALGAGRATVVRQMFTECVLVTLGGAALGAVASIWGADVLRNRMPSEVEWVGVLQPQLSWRVFALSALAAAASAVAFGLLPAIRVAFDIHLDEPLKDDGATTTGRVRHRYNGLVVSEVALALVLLMGGGLLLRTVSELRRSQPGTDMRRLFGVSFAALTRDSAAVRRVDRSGLVPAVASVDGVLYVATIRSRPLPGFQVLAEQTEDTTRIINARAVDVVSASYLRVLGLPVLEGRDFEPGDEDGPGVAIVDAIAARRLYPMGDAVGRMIKLGSVRSDAPWVRVVGIARSPYMMQSADRYVPAPTVLVSMRDDRPVRDLIVRSRRQDPAIMGRVRTRLAPIWPSRVFIYQYDYARQAEIASRTFLAEVFVAMGAVALGLAALGLYGVLAYAVGRRMREFAVRMALGAEARSLKRMILYDGLVMLLAGIGIGAFVALAAARYLDAVLVAVLPSDVVTLVASEAVLLSVGLAAALGPALRAARANPIDIMRAV